MFRRVSTGAVVIVGLWCWHCSCFSRKAGLRAWYRAIDMGKPPPDDERPEEVDRAPRQDDPDRAAILARRQRFIALALSGLATAGCDKPNDEPNAPKGKAAEGKAAVEGKSDPGARPQPCLDVAPEPRDSAEVGSGGDDAKPVPCLEVAPPQTGDEEDPLGSPQACLKVAMPDAKPDEPVPQPCLRVVKPKPDEPKPQPCLRVAKPDKPTKPDEPAKPRPCLKVAKPR